MYKHEEAIINEEAMKGIHDYCERRNLKCKRCRYAISKVNDNVSWTTTCIFANCPCDWSSENWEVTK